MSCRTIIPQAPTNQSLVNLLGTDKDGLKGQAIESIRSYLPHAIIQLDPDWIATFLGVTRGDAIQKVHVDAWNLPETHEEGKGRTAIELAEKRKGPKVFWLIGDHKRNKKEDPIARHLLKTPEGETSLTFGPYKTTVYLHIFFGHSHSASSKQFHRSALKGSRWLGDDRAKPSESIDAPETVKGAHNGVRVYNFEVEDGGDNTFIDTSLTVTLHETKA